MLEQGFLEFKFLATSKFQFYASVWTVTPCRSYDILLYIWLRMIGSDDVENKDSLYDSVVFVNLEKNVFKRAVERDSPIIFNLNDKYRN